jgi:thymidine kinase
VSCRLLSELENAWMEFDVIGIDEGQFFEDVSFQMIFNTAYRSMSFLRKQLIMAKL